MEKIAVIGLDGVSWKIMDSIINEDYFNVISEVLDNSLKADLISTLPPITPPAWTSIATGVNPGKHGIYSFYNIDKLKEGFRSIIVSGIEVCYPRLHEILSLFKIRSLVANLPATYYVPPIISKYVLAVSDWLSPSIKVNDPNHNYLAKAFSKNIVAKDLREPREIGIKLAERVKAIVKSLITAIEVIKPTVMFVVFSETDWIMHKDIGFLKGYNLSYYRDVFLNIDNFIHYLKKQGYKLIFVSDHGFRIYNRIFYPRTLLEEYGYKIGDLAYSWKDKSTIMRRLISFVKKHKYIKNFARKFLVTTKGVESTLRVISYDLVDVLVPDFGYMYVSPNIDVHEILDILNDSGFVKAYKSNQIYKGYCLHKAPDIILTPAKDDLFIARGEYKDTYREDREIADHYYIGIFSIEGYKENHLRVYTHDILPIILSHLGLPIPSDTDSDLTILDKFNLKTNRINIRARWLMALKLSSIKHI